MFPLLPGLLSCSLWSLPPEPVYTITCEDDGFRLSDEVCDDGTDQDCDGTIDCEDADCASAPGCVELACGDGLDDDDDGWTDCFDDDCWGIDGCEVDAAIYVGAGGLERSNRRYTSTATNVHTNGYITPLGTFRTTSSFATYGFTRTVYVDIQADIAGRVELTSPDGRMTACHFERFPVVLRGQQVCSGFGCSPPTQLRRWGGEATACRLDELLPVDINAPGEGVYTASSQELLRASTVEVSGFPPNTDVERDIVPHGGAFLVSKP